MASDDTEEHVTGVRREGGALVITAFCLIHHFVKYVTVALPFLRHAASIPGGGDGVVETIKRGVVVVEDGLQQVGREFVRVNRLPVLGYRGYSPKCRAWRPLTMPAGSRTRDLVFGKIWNHLTHRARIALCPSVGCIPRPRYTASCTSLLPHPCPSDDCRSQHDHPNGCAPQRLGRNP